VDVKSFSVKAWSREQFLKLVASTFLALFSGVWIFIGVKLMMFDPTAEQPTVEYTTAIATTAGFLAATVASITAAILGIEVQRAQTTQTEPLVSATRTAFAASTMLWIGALTYLAVGLFVLVVWLIRSDQAADMVETFALGLLGWLAGGFSSLFRAGG
jgi:hypothetical protein